MKLKVPDWKSAWFENHISDRFFQEMSRIEKSTATNLETTAHWMEQIMIDMGQLAQAMIRLESRDAPDTQIRQAFDKSLRLSALSLHLTTSLEELARSHAQGWSTTAPDPIEELPQKTSPVPLPSFPHTIPVEDLKPSVNTATREYPPMTPPRMEILGLNKDRPDHPARLGGASPTVDRVTSLPPVQHRVDPPRQPPAPPDEFEGKEFSPGLLPTLVNVSGEGLGHAPSQMHQTIRSLSTQGLSRAEIEVITGEPRHIIEAVLDHKAQA